MDDAELARLRVPAAMRNRFREIVAIADEA
jgi:hypothetical protein